MKTVHAVVKVVASEKSRQWPQFLVVLVAAILAVGAGLHFAWTSPSIPKLLQYDLGYNITTQEISHITAISPLGYLIGGPICSLFLDIIGRKKVLLLIAFPQIIAWLLIANASSVWMLYAARLIVGIGESALYTALPPYLCEISEPTIRGILGMAQTLGMMLGIVLINCYGSFLPIRITAYVSLAFPICFLATFAWMPESPYFLLIKKRTEEARSSLKVLRRVQNVEEELTQLTKDVQRQISEPGSLKDVFTIKNNMKAFFIVVGLRALQQFSGISAFSAYTQVVFEESGDGMTPAQSSIIFSASQLIFGMVGAFLIDKYGRRPMVMSSTVGTAVFLFVEGSYFYLKHRGNDLSSFSWIPIVGMMLYTVVFSFGLAGAPNIMMGELLSASVKAKALGLTNIWFAVCLVSTYRLFHHLNESYGMHVPFFFYSACCSVGIVFTYLLVPETKGKSLEEIQQILKKGCSESENAGKEQDVLCATKL